MTGCLAHRPVALPKDLLQRSCEEGERESCSDLGYVYWRGLSGAPRNSARAFQLFARACNVKNLDACVGLATLYTNGEGTARDESLAAQIFQQACSAGNGTACESLGDLYDRGRGVRRDRMHAQFLFDHGCVLAPPVCHELGLRWLYLDFTRAEEYLGRGCDDGYSFSCLFLGVSYAKGVGGASRNDRQARQWAAKGCDAGDALACTLLKRPPSEWHY